MTVQDIPSIVTPNSITLFIEGATKVIDKSNLIFDKVRQALKDKDYDLISELVNPIKKIAKFSNGRLTVDDTSVMFDGTPIHGVMAERLVANINDGFDVTPMSNFLSNLMENPSYRAVQGLYDFLERSQLPITDDGYFLAYKNVKDDYTSWYDSKTQHVLGQVLKMPRNQVNENPEETCSYGLHFCSFSYLPMYTHGNGNRILILKINPKDVVAIPTDYNAAKGRASEYLVMSEYTGDHPLNRFKDEREHFGSSVYTDDPIAGDGPIYAAPDFEARFNELLYYYDQNEDESSAEDVYYSLSKREFKEFLVTLARDFELDTIDVSQDEVPTLEDLKYRVFDLLLPEDDGEEDPAAEEDDYYTHEEAAAALNITSDALRKRIKRGVTVQEVTVDGVTKVILL